MRQLQNFEKRIRGWFPQEPHYLIHEIPQNDKLKLFTRRMAIAVVVGTITAAPLVFIGSLLGLTEGIGMYAWTFTTVMSINAGIMIYAKYTLRKLGLPAGTKPW